jgi:hypothetical protein
MSEVHTAGRSSRPALQRLGSFFGACVFALAIPPVTQIQGDSAALRGLPGVTLMVEATAPELRAYGVTADWLTTRARAQLDSAAVPLMAPADARGSARQPLLVIRLEAVRIPGPPETYAWHLSLAVHQRTVTLGAHRDTTLAQTWAATEVLGVTSGRQLKQSVGASLKLKLKEFETAWRSREE